ncbi:rRNA pseudouridine synthase [candidate division KSB1 bacterium]|nr:rRNA pseudouridine synthase [candidate division KSB1 bacterium]
MIRLNKYLAQCGVGSRRSCDQIIADGRVSVNGKTISILGISIDETLDSVTVDNKPVAIEKRLVYILLNKPRGFVTTASDEKKRKTVLDLIQQKERLFPVGRLDIDTEGLLLLTNDGDLSFRLTHPSYQITKKYFVKVNRSLKPTDVEKLESGVMLDDGRTAPSKVMLDRYDKANKSLYITIHEGRNRQIRRMLETLQYRVIFLKRVQFANLTLKDVRRGEWRILTEQEIKTIKQLVNL